MFFFLLYCAVTIGVYFGFRSKVDPMTNNRWTFELILAIGWPVLMFVTLLLALRIIEVKVPPK